MKKSEIYGAIAIAACFGLFIAAGAETIGALLSLSVPSAVIGLYSAIKHRILMYKGE